MEDTAAARRALEEAGFEVRGERDVLVFDIEDRLARSGTRPASPPQG